MYSKGFFSIVLLALADVNYCFLWADVGGVGSQSDAQIYNDSELAEVLRSRSTCLTMSIFQMTTDHIHISC